MIDVSDIPRAELLAALYNHAQPMGLGFLQARNEPMTVEQAEKLVTGENIETDYRGRPPGFRERAADKPAYFDYLYGRPLKIELNGKTLREDLYDRDQGDGAAQRVIDALRAKLKAA